MNMFFHRLMCTKVYCSPGRRRCQPNTKGTSSDASFSSDAAASTSDVLHKSGKSMDNSNLYSSSYCNSVDSGEPSHVSTGNMEDHLSVNCCMGKDDSGTTLFSWESKLSNEGLGKEIKILSARVSKNHHKDFFYIAKWTVGNGPAGRTNRGRGPQFVHHCLR